MNEHGDRIQVHVCDFPFSQTWCSACGLGRTKDGPGMFKITVGVHLFVLCYGCLEKLSMLCRVFVFKKTVLRIPDA